MVYRVDLGKGRQVLAHATGMAERNFVRLLPGDKVEIELAPADATRGRILKKVESAFLPVGRLNESASIGQKDLR